MTAHVAFDRVEPADVVERLAGGRRTGGGMDIKELASDVRPASDLGDAVAVEVLEPYITKTRDKAAALTFMKKTLKRYGSPEAITTDGLASYKAAMKLLGNSNKQEIGRWAMRMIS